MQLQPVNISWYSYYRLWSTFVSQSSWFISQKHKNNKKPSQANMSPESGFNAGGAFNPARMMTYIMHNFKHKQRVILVRTKSTDLYVCNICTELSTHKAIINSWSTYATNTILANLTALNNRVAILEVHGWTPSVCEISVAKPMCKCCRQLFPSTSNSLTL